MKNLLIVLITFLFTFNSCTTKSKDNKNLSKPKESSSKSSHSNYSSDDKTEYSRSYYTEDGVEDETEDIIEDGTHEANVSYYNPNTGHQADYSLSVEVENGEVTKIYWPNGGWSDEDHISSGELDEEGNTTIEGEDGQTYDIEIDD